MGRWQRRTATVGATLALAVAAAEVVVAPPARALAPAVVVLLPLTGPIGTSVTITGTGFADSSTANGVAFNGTPGNVLQRRQQHADHGGRPGRSDDRAGDGHRR